MPFLTSAGRRIYYERHGTGPAILFLHGAGSNAATWWQQLPVFSSRYSCLTMDIRCFGRSVAPTSEFDLGLMADDVLALFDAEQVHQAVVIGQSLGGMIGLRVALRHPKRVVGFVACDSSMAIDHPALLELVSKRLQSARGVSIEQRSLGKWFVEQHPPLAALYAQINHFNPSAHAVPAEQWQDALVSLLAPAALTPVDALRELACPTLFLVGSEDPLVPASVMHECSGLVPDSAVVVIEQAGHSAYFEKPQEFNRLVIEFIAGRVELASDRAPTLFQPGLTAAGSAVQIRDRVQ